MKKKARIIISTSTGEQAPDTFIDQMLIKAILADSNPAEFEALTADEFANEYGYDMAIPEEALKPRGDGKTVVSVIGELEEDNGTVNIRYMESEITNMMGTETVISFSDPDEVTMVRTGGVSTALCFNRDLQRRICWYNETLFPIDISVITERFKNTVDGTKGGTLDVLYSVEMKGLTMERSHFTLQVKPL